MKPLGALLYVQNIFANIFGKGSRAETTVHVCRRTVCFSTKLAQASGGGQISTMAYSDVPEPCPPPPPMHLQVHTVYNTEAQFIVPDWGDKVYYDIGLSYPAVRDYEFGYSASTPCFSYLYRAMHYIAEICSVVCLMAY